MYVTCTFCIGRVPVLEVAEAKRSFGEASIGAFHPLSPFSFPGPRPG